MTDPKDSDKKNSKESPRITKLAKRNYLVGAIIVLAGVVVTGVSLLGFVGNADLSKFYLANKIFSTPTTASASEQKALSLPKASFLDCSAVRNRTMDFLKLHFSFRNFSEELSSRTFNRFFQILDPGKNFFLVEDIIKYSKYEKNIAVNLARLDCGFIYEIYSLFKQRVSESNAYVDSEVTKSFDLAQDESMETDRKKIPWAKSSIELKNRWRQQFKFLALNIKDPELTKEAIIVKLKKRHSLMQKNILEKNMDEVDGMFLEAFASSLDPHSQFQMPADQNEFKAQFALQLVGIGAQLSSIDGYTIIEGIIPGGPASRDGRLRKGDKIIAVDSGDGNAAVNVVDMDLNKVVQLIRGKKDTLVKLSILRKDDSGEVKKIVLELVRDIVNLPDGAAKSAIMPIDGKKIGVILLPSFYRDYEGSRKSEDFRSSANDIGKEIIKLKAQKVDGIILDLRTNGGGDLGECIKMTGFFIDKGSVVQVKNNLGNTESLDDNDEGTLYSGPLAILVSKQSASASEIISGALKDYGRAIILGNSRTYGKATVQHVIDIEGTQGRDSNGALRVTVSKFFQPSGGSNQCKGVISDVVIPDLFEPLPIAEEVNEYALPHSEIMASRTFKKIQDLDSIIPALKKNSEERVSKSEKFKELSALIKKAELERDNTIFVLKQQTKDDAKKGKVKGAPTATPSPTPTPNPADPGGVKVIDTDDIQLNEAAKILLDSIKLLGNKTDWTK